MFGHSVVHPSTLSQFSLCPRKLPKQTVQRMQVGSQVQYVLVFSLVSEGRVGRMVTADADAVKRQRRKGLGVGALTRNRG